jgi:hypothetical protein
LIPRQRRMAEATASGSDRPERRCREHRCHNTLCAHRLQRVTWTRRTHGGSGIPGRRPISRPPRTRHLRARPPGRGASAGSKITRLVSRSLFTVLQPPYAGPPDHIQKQRCAAGCGATKVPLAALCIRLPLGRHSRLVGTSRRSRLRWRPNAMHGALFSFATIRLRHGRAWRR